MVGLDNLLAKPLEQSLARRQQAQGELYPSLHSPVLSASSPPLPPSSPSAGPGLRVGSGNWCVTRWTPEEGGSWAQRRPGPVWSPCLYRGWLMARATHQYFLNEGPNSGQTHTALPSSGVEMGWGVERAAHGWDWGHPTCVSSTHFFPALGCCLWGTKQGL